MKPLNIWRLLILQALCICTLLMANVSLQAQNKQALDTVLLKGKMTTIYLPQKKKSLPQEDDSTPDKIKAVQDAENEIVRELNDYVLEMQSQKFISDNVVTEVKLDVIEGEEPALKVVYSYYLVNDTLKFQTDDFSLGNYRIESSNALLVTLAVMKTSIEKQLSKYLTPGKEVFITIDGNADALPIRKTIDYHGEYGNPIVENCIVEGKNQLISISSSDGIDNNISLAFLRSCGVRTFIKNEIKPLEMTNNKFIHRASVSKFQGGRYRRVFIEMVVPSAFTDIKTP